MFEGWRTIYLFRSWVPQTSHSCKKTSVSFVLKLIDALLRSVKKDEDIFCIHEDTRSCKRHTLLRLWTTACTAAPPKEEVKSSPCWSTMVTTDSKSSARRLVVPLSLPECTDIIEMGQFMIFVREQRSSVSKTR